VIKKLTWDKLFAIGALTCFFALCLWSFSLGAIIGNDNLEATDFSSDPGRGFATASLTPGDNAGIYTAITGDNVDTLVWYGDRGATPTTLTVVMAIFTVINDSVPNALVDSASVQITSDTKQFWPVVVNIPLTNGVKYIYAWVAKDEHSYEAKRLSCNDCTGQSILAGAAFADPWVSSGTDVGIVFTGYGFVSNTPVTGDKVMVRK